MLLIRLLPYVYCDVEENTVMFYNTLNGDIKSQSFLRIFSSPNRNTLFVSEESNTKCLINTEEIKSFGYIDSVKNDKITILSDYSSTIPKSYDNITNDKSVDNNTAQTCVTRLSIDLIGNSSKVFSLGDANACSSKHMKEETLNKLMNSLTYFKNIGQINIKVCWTMIERYHQQFAYIANYHKILYFNIFFSDYKAHSNRIINLCNKVDVTIQSIHDLTSSDLRIIQSEHVRNIYLVIRSTNDLELYQHWQLWRYKNIHIHLDYSMEINELKNILSYDLGDITTGNISKNNLIRQEYINPLYWGELYINADGSIWISPNESIGNVLEWSAINFNDVINAKKSLWRKVRKDFHLCNKCLYRNICPPLSAIELYHDTVFCNQNKIF